VRIRNRERFDFNSIGASSDAKYIYRFSLNEYDGEGANPDPTLIGLINHRQQASDGPSELSVPRFENSPEV